MSMGKVLQRYLPAGGNAIKGLERHAPRVRHIDLKPLPPFQVDQLVGTVGTLPAHAVLAIMGASAGNPGAVLERIRARPAKRLVAVDDVFELKVDALTALESQTFEGGALGNATVVAERPPASDPVARRAWLREGWDRRQSREAERYREALVKWYGAERAAAVRHAEAFEICEFGRQPSDAEIRRLFPFLPEP